MTGSESSRAAALARLLRSSDIWRTGDRLPTPVASPAASPAAGPNTAGITHTGFVPTGHPRLDAALAGNGWPLGAIVEVMFPGMGVGELGLLFPALARLAGSTRKLVWIAPPVRLRDSPNPLNQDTVPEALLELDAIPNLHAWRFRGIAPSSMLFIREADRRRRLWAAEQCLRSPACAAVLLWQTGSEKIVDSRYVRRLQLAAEHGRGVGFLLRELGGAAKGAPGSAPGSVTHTDPFPPAASSSPAAVRLCLSSSQHEGETQVLIDILKCRGAWPTRVRIPRVEFDQIGCNGSGGQV